MATLQAIERALLISITIAVIAWIAQRLPSEKSAAKLQQQTVPAPTPAAAATMRFLIDDSLRDAMLSAVQRNVSGGELELFFEPLSTDAARRDLANSIHVAGVARRTALFLACLVQSAEMTRVLVSMQANISAGRFDEGTTPLHLAAGWKHSDAVLDALLASSDTDAIASSLQAKPHSGGLRVHTPAWWAEFYGHRSTHVRLIAWMRDNAGLQYEVESDEFTHAQETQVQQPAAPSPRETSDETTAATTGDGAATTAATIGSNNRRAAMTAAIAEPMGAAEAVAALDAAGGGAVSLAELTLLLQLTGRNPTIADGERYRERLRGAGVEAVTGAVLEEVLRWHEDDHPMEEEAASIEAAWSVIDTNGDGVVRDGEMAALLELLRTKGEPLTDDEVEEFVSAVDGDGDGEISKAEFDAMLRGNNA